MTSSGDDGSNRASSGAPASGDRRRQERDEVFSGYLEELEAAGRPKVVTYDDLRRRLADYRVVVVGGFSGRGYRRPEVVRQKLRELVEARGDRSAYVIGATADGIGRAYAWIRELAAELGLEVRTAGIVSRNGAELGVAAQDWVVFVDTPVDDWEVRVDGRSLMVSIAADTGGEMVYFGGGEVARAEIEEAVERGVPVTLYTGEGMAPGEGPSSGPGDTSALAASPPAGLEVITVVRE